MLYLIGFCVTQTDGKLVIVILIVTGAGFKYWIRFGLCITVNYC